MTGTNSIVFAIDGATPEEVEWAAGVLASVLDLTGWHYVATMYDGHPLDAH
jgi:hypothetical protein